MSIERVFNEIEGWFFEGEARMMNRRAAEIDPPNVIVEIGSYRGKSTCALALHARTAVYAIDPHIMSIGETAPFGDEDRRVFTQNVLEFGLAARVKPINLPSLDVAKIWNLPIGLLFIDGDHSLVEDDINAWMPFVVDGGQIAFHDANGPAIIRAIASRTDMVEVERSNLTAVFVKEPLYEPHTYDGLTLLVRKGPYNHDDKYVLGEVRSYDIGTEPIRTCIDVGAHIGAFSAWIHQLYPDARIVAVEPEMSGYLAARQNLNFLPPDQLLNRRVNYDAADKVLYVDPVNSGSHTILDQGAPGQPVVPAPNPITLEEIMYHEGWDELDLLKIDCEGCEYDVLLNCEDGLLKHTRRIVGEFHRGNDHFMATIGARLVSLGFQVTGTPDDGISHSVFVAVNQMAFVAPQWQKTVLVKDTSEEPPFEYGLPFTDEVTQVDKPKEESKPRRGGRRKK